MRAFTSCGTEITRERYGVEDPKYAPVPLRRAGQLLGLTEAQPENNVLAHRARGPRRHPPRTPAPRALQLPAWNGRSACPALGPAVVAAPPAGARLRETDLLEYDDIFDGSHVIAAKVAELVERACRDRPGQAMGGAIAAVGYMKRLVSSTRPGRPDRVRRRGRGGRQPVHRRPSPRR